MEVTKVIQLTEATIRNINPCQRKFPTKPVTLGLQESLASKGFFIPLAIRARYYREVIVSKFFAIIVEDLGDTDGKVFSNSDQFFFSTIVQPPTDCEIRGCVEIPEPQAQKMLAPDPANKKLS